MREGTFLLKALIPTVWDTSVVSLSQIGSARMLSDLTGLPRESLCNPSLRSSNRLYTVGQSETKTGVSRNTNGITRLTPEERKFGYKVVIV